MKGSTNNYYQGLAIVLLILSSVLLAGKTYASPYKILLNGEWEFVPENQRQNSIVTVPGNWHSHGFDVESASYKRSFYVDKKQKNQIFSLTFEGSDYFTSVWLNGQFVGEHEGYFQAFTFDISRFLVDGKNDIKVNVSSPRENEEDFSLNKTLIKGIFSHHDTRPGNAWSDRGQEKNTGGIWNDVYIAVSTDISLNSFTYIAHPHPLYESDWRLTVNPTLGGSIPKKSKIEFQLSEINGNSTRSLIKEFTLTDKQDHYSLRVHQPRLWWPKEYGSQNQYRLVVSIKDQNNTVLDTKVQNIGFREITVDENKTWFVNGKRIFLKGTNYIGTQWLSEMSKEDYLKDIQLMLNANMNVVRVHAHITDQVFYDLCDELGLLVWQDFPLQWGYKDSKKVHASALRQVEDMIDQFGHHPSIIQWSIHNEPPWDSPWMKYKYDNYSKTQNKLLDEKLYQLAKSKDTSRYVAEISSGLEHPWFGWYSGTWKDYRKTSKSPWITEFGAQALPDLSVLKTIIPEESLWPDTPEEWELWEYHNFQERENFKLAKIDKGETIEELIHNSQEYQRHLVKYAAESYRRQSYEPVTAIFQFMFVENWPSMNWAIVDYLRNPKPAYGDIQMAYQSLLPSAEVHELRYQSNTEIEFPLWLVNDTMHSYDHLSYHVSLLNSDNNQPIHSQEWQISSDKFDKSQFATFRMPNNVSEGSYRLALSVVFNDKLVAKNTYKFTIEE